MRHACLPSGLFALLTEQKQSQPSLKQEAKGKGVVMSKKQSTFRLQVIGGEKLQDLYTKLSEGQLVELVPEKPNRVAVYGTIKKFIGSKREYLGYLYKSEEIAKQMERGDKFLDTQVAGFYDDDERGHGHILIIQVTVEKA